MPETMRRWELGALGRANLKLVDVPVPSPGELLVRVGAVTLNFRDGDMIANGIGGALPWPFTPASDMAGTVVAIGEGVPRFQPGDRVISLFEPDWTEGTPPGNGGRLREGRPGSFALNIPLSSQKEIAMLERRILFGAVIGLGLLTGGAKAQSVEPAGLRMNEPGPENEAMAKRAGLWDLTETVWERPGAAPIVTTNLVAERRMIGTMFQEILRPADEPGTGKVRRIDYLHFNRVEGRWDYVSMDMSAPVGIMSAWSFDRGENARIDITFAPFSVPGPAVEVTGQMLRMTQTISYGEPDRDVKDQYFLLADGTGTKWLAHRYAYKRRE